MSRIALGVGMHSSDSFIFGGAVDEEPGLEIGRSLRRDIETEQDDVNRTTLDQ